MSRFPRLSGEDVMRALLRAQFQLVRQRGSHVVLRHADGRTTVVPVHRAEVLGPGIMSKILRDIGMTRSEFTRLLGR